MSRSHLLPKVSRNGHEQLFDRNGARNEILLGHVLHQRFERRPVGLEAVGPGIAAEYIVDFLDLRLQPGQHGGKRAGIAQARKRAALCIDERLVEARGKPAMLLMELAADGDEVHDWKDLVLLVKLALERAIV